MKLESGEEWVEEIILRKDKEENIKRNDIKLTKNNIFIELLDFRIEEVKLILQSTLKNIRFNTFYKLINLYDIKKITTDKDLREIYEEMDHSQFEKSSWAFCIWLAKIIKDKLDKIGIHSYFIRFDAWWTLNDNYLVNWHTALCIPRLIWWEKAFTLIDPWMLISEPITFWDKKEANYKNIWWLDIQIRLKEKEKLPYVMKINWKELFFDPYNIWLNVDETLWKDLFSSIWNFKIIKQDKYWKPLCYFRFDIKNEIITFKVLSKEWKKLRLDFTFTDFLDLDNNKELLELFHILTISLWEKDIELFKEKINKAIKIMPDFKKNIWVDSTKSNIYSLK
jgi:hypothetical protein